MRETNPSECPETRRDRGRDWNGRRMRPFATRSRTPPSSAPTAIGRKKLGLSHSKLKEVLHQDFADCSALAEALSGQDRSSVLPGRVYRGSD